MRVVIPCGAKKAAEPRPAGALYLGSLFRANLAYARAIAAPAEIRIVSAKYGFLALDQVVAPYDVRFGRAGEIAAAELARQAQALGWAGEDVLALGGIDYVRRVQAVFPGARSVLAEMHASVGGTGLGYQLRWLKLNRGVAL